MKFHREGRQIILATLVLTGGISSIAYALIQNEIVVSLIIVAMAVVLYLVVQFFRVPKRTVPNNDPNTVLCPSDGKVVVIEEVEENEFLKGGAIQISIFMSPMNVHVNWHPVKGEVLYTKYHPGKFLVAYNPKSSELNERTTVVTKAENGDLVLFRQIAGAVARRICLFAKEGDQAQLGQEYGFIKFGSRIDVFLPKNAKINVKLGQKVKGIETILANLS